MVSPYKDVNTKICVLMSAGSAHNLLLLFLPFPVDCGRWPAFANVRSDDAASSLAMALYVFCLYEGASLRTASGSSWFGCLCLLHCSIK